jgi:hypothetical protein
MFLLPVVLISEGEAVWLVLLLSLLIFVVFAALFIYLMRSALKSSGVRWAFGFFPPGVVLWKKRSVEEELSELRSYEVWLRSELERVRKEIEEREKRNL